MLPPVPGVTGSKTAQAQLCQRSSELAGLGVVNRGFPCLAIPATIALCRDGDGKVIENPRHPMRELAVSGIAVTAASLGPAGEQLIPGLIQCLRDTTPDIPENAALALGRLKMSPELTVPALVTSLQRLNSQLRASAAVSLAAFQADALPALPALTDLLGDADASVRLAATNAVRVLNAVALTNAPPR